jgi:CheY-like chemotaxis protein
VPALRILIVDDYEDNGAVLAAALGAKGHVATWVPDGAGALAKAPDFRPDVAIVDILLPDMNGYDLGRELRAIPSLAKLCLIAITGFSRDPREAREAGFHGHVMKPVSLEKLETVIRECHALANPVP